MTTSESKAVVTPAPSQHKSFWTRSPIFHMGLIFLIWCVVYIPGLFLPGLLDDADSMHAEVAREMLLRHDWVTLCADGVRYLQKAPLMYWEMASSFKLFGVSEWQARLPLALSVLALLVCVYLLGRHVYGSRGGFWAAVIVVTSLGVFIFTRFLIPNIIVGLWLTVNCYCFLKLVENPDDSRLYAWGFAAAAALGVLTMGLVGVVFPLAIIFVYLLVTRNLRLLRRMHLFTSAIVFLVIAAPWHILASLRNPAQGRARGFFWFYFINEQFLRYLNERYPHDYNTVPLLLFWGLILVWLIPWSAFLPGVAREVHLPKAEGIQSRRDMGNLLFAIWAIIIPLFFSFSSRQAYYVLPALPGFALLIGGWLDREARPGERRARRTGVRAAKVLCVLGVLVLAAGIGLLVEVRRPAAGTHLSALVTHHPKDYTFSLGHMLDITPHLLVDFQLPLLIFVLALALGTVLNLAWRRRGKPGVGNVFLTVMMVFVLFSTWLGFVKFSPLLSSKSLAMAINKVYEPGDVIVIRGEYEAGSSLNFYTKHQVHMLHGGLGLWYGSLFPDCPKVWETNQSFRTLWKGKKRVFLWTKVAKPPILKGLPAFILAREGGKMILTNQR